MKSPSQIKQEALIFLKGNWPSAIGLNVAPLIFTSVILFLALYIIAAIGGGILALALSTASPAELNDSNSYIYSLSSFIMVVFLQGLSILYLVATFICNIIRVGIATSNLDWYQKNDSKYANFGNAFRYFNGQSFGQAFGLYFMVFLYTSLWALIPFAGLVLVIVKSYSYSQAFYIYRNNTEPGLSASDFIKQSRQLMKGQKWKLFIQDLSFTGWFLLSLLSFGIAGTFLTPYFNISRVIFYDNLISEANIA